MAQVPFETRGEAGRCLSHYVCVCARGRGSHVSRAVKRRILLPGCVCGGAAAVCGVYPFSTRGVFDVFGSAALACFPLGYYKWEHVRPNCCKSPAQSDPGRTCTGLLHGLLLPRGAGGRNTQTDGELPRAYLCAVSGVSRPRGARQPTCLVSLPGVVLGRANAISAPAGRARDRRVASAMAAMR